MGRENRLRTLQMRISGENHLLMSIRRRDERFLKHLEPPIDPIERFARPELEVGRDLVIPTPRSMQLTADVADPFDQRRFDMHMDVFPFKDKRERAGLNLGPDIRQSLHNLSAFFASDQINTLEHLSVGDRTLDIVLEEPMIKGDGFRKLFDAAICSFRKPAGPRLIRQRVAPMLQVTYCARLRHTTASV
jgi:hypothetical protein